MLQTNNYVGPSQSIHRDLFLVRKDFQTRNRVGFGKSSEVGFPNFEVGKLSLRGCRGWDGFPSFTRF